MDWHHVQGVPCLCPMLHGIGSRSADVKATMSSMKPAEGGTTSYKKSPGGGAMVFLSGSASHRTTSLLHTAIVEPLPSSYNPVREESLQKNPPQVKVFLVLNLCHSAWWRDGWSRSSVYLERCCVESEGAWCRVGCDGPYLALFVSVSVLNLMKQNKGIQWREGRLQWGDVGELREHSGSDSRVKNVLLDGQ